MQYRGSGFWVRDYQAEVWLYLLAQQAQAMADAPLWLAAAGRDWHAQATVGFMGCVSSCLDEHLGTRVAALTISQITRHDDSQDITIRLGQHNIPVPEPLGKLLLTLAADGKPHTGTGTPPDREWLFPGLLPGRPITPARLAQRLRTIGIPVMAGRRATLISLAAQMPAAVLADLLGLKPTTTVRWMHQAGADWNRYAAELARERNHKPGE